MLPVVDQEVDVPVVSHQQCERQLQQTRLGYDFKLHQGFVCAGGEEGKDACKVGNPQSPRWNWLPTPAGATACCLHYLYIRNADKHSHFVLTCRRCFVSRVTAVDPWCASAPAPGRW